MFLQLDKRIYRHFRYRIPYFETKLQRKCARLKFCLIAVNGCIVFTNELIFELLIFDLSMQLCSSQ